VKLSAPGKVILFGEYAVLSGYDAVVIAVDRYAHLHRKSETGDFKVVAENVGHYHPANEIYDLPFAEAIHQIQPDLQGCWLTETHEFSIESKKLGLGSSAAATVTMAAAALGFSVEDRSAVYRLAQHAHRQVQGLGSGADIAASVFGGALRYSWTERPNDLGASDNQALHTPFGSARIEHLPETQIPIHLVWSGHSARTTDLVNAVHRFAAQDTHTFQRCIEDINGATRMAIEGWSDEDRLPICAAIRAGHAAIEKLGSATGVPLITPAHHKIAQLVAEDGAMKSTGAGGGDLVWFMGKSPEKDRYIKKKLEAAGFPVFECRMAPGVSCIPTPLDKE